MKSIIATEQILSPLGHTKAIKYHYEDGTSRTVPLKKVKETTEGSIQKLIKKS